MNLENSTIKILVADDHFIVRKGIRSFLQSVDEFQSKIEEAENGAEVIDLISKSAYDILLLDLEMPKMNGMKTLEKLRGDGNQVPVLVISFHSDELLVKRVLEAGGNGYVSKDVIGDELIDAILTTMDGGRYLSGRIERLMNGDDPADDSLFALNDQLTKREVEVLKLIAEDNTNIEIADKLCISVRTVEGHKKNLRFKLNTKGSVGLAKYAYQKGLVKL